MNALNILSGLNSPPLDTPPRSRTPSSSNVDPRGLEDAEADKREDSESSVETLPHDTDSAESKPESDDLHAELDEKTPLLQQHQQATEGFQEYSSTSVWRIPKRISNALFSSFEIVLATITAPARYLVACFYDDQGSFSALLPIRRLDRMVSRRKRRKSAAHTVGPRSAVEDKDFAEKPRIRPKSEVEDTPGDATLSEDTTDTVRSDSDAERPSSEADDSPFRNTRSKSAPRDEIAPPKKSIRISLHNDAALKKRHRLQKSLDGSPKSEEDQVAAVANSLKSPSSPAFAPKLKYPRAPAPPRPLVPRRHPSYTVAMSTETPKKTLVIDLDETLIHSMAKGGRMSTGHMVEVKFQGPIGGGGIVLGPQVPILYYVHERPHCHEFLRKVSRQHRWGPAFCCEGSRLTMCTRYASGITL